MHSSRMRTGRSLTVCRVYLVPGVYLVLGGVLSPGSVLSPGGELSPRGVPCSRGGVWYPGVPAQGVSAPWGVVSQHALRQTTPPPCEQNDKQV